MPILGPLPDLRAGGDRFFGGRRCRRGRWPFWRAQRGDRSTLAPTTGKTNTLQSIMDKIASAAEESSDAEAVDVSACPVKRNNPLTTAVNGLRLVEPTGLKIPAKGQQTSTAFFPAKLDTFLIRLVPASLQDAVLIAPASRRRLPTWRNKRTPRRTSGNSAAAFAASCSASWDGDRPRSESSGCEY
jgi:hypothetical protein